MGQLTDPGRGDRDGGPSPSPRRDAEGRIERGRASAVHRAAALEREGARSRGFCAVLLWESGILSPHACVCSRDENLLTDINDIIFIFIFLIKFGFEYR